MSIGQTSQTSWFYDEPVVVDNKKTDPRLDQVGVFRRYQGISVESIKAQGIPKELESVASDVFDYIDNIKAKVRKGEGLFLKGGVGTLKTTFAVAIIQKALDENISARFFPMASLVDTLFSLKNAEERAIFEQRINNTKILVIDDLGAEMQRDWVLNKIDALVTERYNRMLPTIFTSNLSNEELLERYNRRTLDRIKESCKFLTFNCKSLRQAVKG